MTFISPTSKKDENWDFSFTNVSSSRIANDSMIYYAYDSKGNLSITNKPNIINFNEVFISNPNYKNVDGTITIKETGIYFLSFTIISGSDGLQGSTRGSLHSYIEIDQGKGFEVYPGSKVSNYMREQIKGITDYLITKTIPIKIESPNSKIRIMCLNESTTTKSITQKEESTLFINKLSSSYQHNNPYTNHPSHTPTLH